MHSYKVQTKDKKLLHVQQWCDAKKPKGIILIIHGLGEHQGRYMSMAKYFCDNGFQTYSYDQRGHGLSEGKRGHSPGLDYTLDDLERVLKTISHQRLFIYGHSFGGNVLANFMRHKQPNYISGIILSAAWFKLAQQPRKIDFLVANILNTVYPSLTKNNRLKVTDLSNIKKVQDDYLEDKLNHTQASARLFLAFHKAGLEALEDSHKLTCKALLIHGEDDAIISIEGSKAYHNNSGGKTTFISYPKIKHEPHNDLLSDKVLEHSLSWFENC